MKKGFEKKFIFIVLISLLIIASISFVLADETARRAGEEARKVGQWIVDFFLTIIFGGGWEEGALDPRAAVIHIFMGLVLLLLIYSVFDTMGFFKTEENNFNWLNWLISIGVTMIVLIALPPDFFNYILPGYGAMGAAIMSVLPFIIIFGFTIKIRSVPMGQMVWFFFSAYFIGFYVLTSLRVFDNTWEGTIGGLFYLVIGGLGVFMIFFFPVLRNFILKGQTEGYVQSIESGGKILAADVLARGDEAKARKKVGEWGPH